LAAAVLWDIDVFSLPGVAVLGIVMRGAPGITPAALHTMIGHVE
jgi:hypothetical protein